MLMSKTVAHRIPDVACLAEMAALAAFSVLPLGGAALGVLVDERLRSGFTNWRSACRASGFSFESLVSFSFELLPAGIAGLLIGGVALLGIGVALRERGRNLERCLAVHAGCALSMPIGLSLCALAVPVSVTLVTDVLLTVSAAWLVINFALRREHSSVVLRTRAPPNR